MKRWVCYAVGVYWMMWGVMHFTVHDEAVRQIPDWIPLKSFLVYLTGVGELAAGAGMFVPRARVYAGYLGAGLLAVFTPAVLHIVIHDIEPVDWPEAARAVFRWIMIPHNLAFGYLCVRIARQPPARSRT